MVSGVGGPDSHPRGGLGRSWVVVGHDKAVGQDGSLVALFGSGSQRTCKPSEARKPWVVGEVWHLPINPDIVSDSPIQLDTVPWQPLVPTAAEYRRAIL